MGNKKESNAGNNSFIGKDDVPDRCLGRRRQSERQTPDPTDKRRRERRQTLIWKWLRCPRKASAPPQVFASLLSVAHANRQTCAIVEHLSLCPR
jgi:hypothetical protein